MEQFFRELRIKVLIIRVVLGVIFAFLLSRLFIPRASLLTIFGLAGMLTLAAYVLEIFHRGPKS